MRAGPFVFVSGTAAADGDGHVVGAGDPHAQAMHILATIESALREAGASMRDVVRTRIFVTNADHWEEIGRAHAEYFGDVRPACTLVEVRRLLSPEMLVEIEADAVVGEEYT